MKRVLITGMSGTGKSTLMGEFAALGYKTIDTDLDGWCTPADGPASIDGVADPDWIWHEGRMRELLSAHDADVLFVSGCRSNQGKFYPCFDEIVLLTAPREVIIERLSTRTTNPYGRSPAELAQVLDFLDSVEPVLRETASMVVDTSVPVQDVVKRILTRMGETRP
ncbi:AAA family ATPase [Actinopolymorpha pittospori]